MYERFTDRARRVLQQATREALRFQHEYVGTEHLLLALTREVPSSAVVFITDQCVDPRKIRLEVEKIIKCGPDPISVGVSKLPHTPRAKKVIEYAIEEARRHNSFHVGTEHILAGLLKEKEGIAYQVLNSLNLSYDQMIDSDIFLKASKLQAKIAILEMQKEEAICGQDFVRASEIRDEIDKLKRDWLYVSPTKKENADHQSEEALHLIVCVLLKYLLDEKGSTETLVEINKIIQECL